MRSLLGLRLKKYGFIDIPPILVKCRSCSPYRVAFHRRFLSSKEHRAATSQQIFWTFYLSCSKVRVSFISSPIFLIASCCFFVLLIHVKHGFLFPENLIPPTLCKFGELHSLDGSINIKCATHKKWFRVVESWLLIRSLTIIDSKLPCSII